MGLSSWLPERRRKQPTPIIDDKAAEVMTSHQIGMIAREAALSQTALQTEQYFDALVEINDLKAALDSLENKMQAELLKQGMQIDALLRFCGNKVEKNPVEFHTEPERVEVQRRKA